MNNLPQAISKGITFLESQQLKDGSFLSLSSPNSGSFKDPIIFPSLFSTALILICLSDIDTVQVFSIKKRIVNFLLKQKSTNWTFNYWNRNSKEFKKFPYPDDLDDTSVALSGIHLFNSSLLSGTVLAKIISVLTTQEVNEGGPYRTWLADSSAPSEWKDVDLAVNCNIAYFLSLFDVNLPSLDKLIDTAIHENKIASPYYTNNLAILYFISRFYKGKYLSQFILLIDAAIKKNRNPLNVALGITSLINIGQEKNIKKSDIEYLLKTQKDQSWDEASFYTGVSDDNTKKYFAGSRALSTAIVIEALNKYQQSLTYKKEKKENSELEQNMIISKVLLNIKDRTKQLNKSYRHDFLKFLEAIANSHNGKEIVLLPYYFYSSLELPHKKITQEKLVTLGIINLLGWMAFTIYDDFYDDEGNPKQLPIANLCLRTLTAYLEQISTDKNYSNFVNGIIDKVDEANRWELYFCRPLIKQGKMDLNELKLPSFGNFRIIAQKSLGHAIGPLTILYLLGLNEKSPEMKNLTLFFYNYLIAKQLNDDAHDFAKDLKKGHLNPVNTLLLSRYLLKSNQKEVMSVNKLTDNLQSIFWHEELPTVCARIKKHLNKSRFYLSKIDLIARKEILDQLLLPIEEAYNKALKERDQALLLLNSFK